MTDPNTEHVTAEIVPTSPTDLAISSEIDEINALHDLAQADAQQAKQLAERACQNAVILGIKLETLKSRVPHGGWVPMFKDEDGKGSQIRTRFVFGIRTAQKYMLAAQGALSRPGLPAAAKKRLLALAAPDAQVTDQHYDDLSKATAGQTLRQLYLDLGIIRAGATETSGSGGYHPPKGERPPPPPEADLIWEEIVHPLRVIDQYISGHGRIAALDPARLAQVIDILAANLDVLRNLNPR
jgi:hypothetical protein